MKNGILAENACMRGSAPQLKSHGSRPEGFSTINRCRRLSGLLDPVDGFKHLAGMAEIAGGCRDPRCVAFSNILTRSIVSDLAMRLKANFSEAASIDLIDNALAARHIALAIS